MNIIQATNTTTIQDKFDINYNQFHYIEYVDPKIYFTTEELQNAINKCEGSNI